jgi:outer membrane protein TolC
VEAARGPNPLQLSVRYSHVGGGNPLLNASPLFAGSGLAPEISTRVPLRQTGELTAEKRLLLAKLNKLERELEQLEDDIRAQVTETQIRYESTRDDIAIARKRLDLDAEREQVTAARLRAGLETAASLAAAKDARDRGARELARLEYSGQSTLATLFSLCGIRNQPAEKQEMLIAALSSPGR